MGEFAGSDSSDGEDEEHEEPKNHLEEGNPAVYVVARLVYGFRFLFLFAWPAIAVALAPSAWKLVLNAAPMTKHAPRRTESTQAMAVFEEHFKDLSIIRREMVVFRCRGPCETAVSDLSRGYVMQVVDLVKRFDHDNPGIIVQVTSYYTFAGHHQIVENPMISADSRSILMQWLWRVPDSVKGKAEEFIEKMQELVRQINTFQSSDGLEASFTGLITLDHAIKQTLIEEIPVHEISTIWMPFIILAFALRSYRMLILALIPMPIEILIAFGLMYFVSLHTTVLFYALMMMLMLCTSLSFDYSLFTLTRYAEERALGEPVKDAILTVVAQSGRVVVVSGCVLMIAWAAMLGLPSPFNTFCVAACTMILVCVCVQLTFVPSLLAVCPFLGPPAAESKLSRSSSRSREDSPTGTAMLQDRAGAADRTGFTDDAMIKAAPHMKGLGFLLGKWLTAFPFNILVPLTVYALMMPLTLRMSKNFDFSSFKFEMGHSYELTVPRQRKEWETALRIQRDFPSTVGILMPMLIIATNALPPSQNDTDLGPLGAAENAAENVVREAPPPLLPASSTPAPVDVRGDEFFNANCRMVNSVIAATKNKSYELRADNFLSATFHGEDEESGGVKCLSYWQVDLVRTNYFSRKWFLSHTSKNLQMEWDRLVSKENHAMLTFMFPTMDPFSPEAFELVRAVREVLRNETRAAQELNSAIPGLTFKTFSPGSVLMDLIDVTSGRLPLTFLGCVSVCLVLIAAWFGAWFIPLKLLLTVVVPITWTYGAALFVYSDGWLLWLNLPGLASQGDAGIDWTVPMFSLTFIVGLAMDYEIFLIERVREFRLEGFGDRESIQLGLAATGDTITCAGLIMALTFIAQLLGSIPVTNQLGFILVFSIVVDTFIVRTVLVPAMLSLIPAVNYYPTRMPKPRFEWLSGCHGSPNAPASGKGTYAHDRSLEEDEDDNDEPPL